MTLQFDLPDNLLQAPPAELRLAIAAQLFGQRKLSSSQAAELAGVSRIAFLANIGRFGVPILDLTPEELAQDICNARKHS